MFLNGLGQGDGSVKAPVTLSDLSWLAKIHILVGET